MTAAGLSAVPLRLRLAWGVNTGTREGVPVLGECGAQSPAEKARSAWQRDDEQTAAMAQQPGPQGNGSGCSQGRRLPGSILSPVPGSSRVKFQ